MEDVDSNSDRAVGAGGDDRDVDRGSGPDDRTPTPPPRTAVAASSAAPVDDDGYNEDNEDSGTIHGDGGDDRDDRGDRPNDDGTTTTTDRAPRRRGRPGDDDAEDGGGDDAGSLAREDGVPAPPPSSGGDDDDDPAPPQPAAEAPGPGPSRAGGGRSADRGGSASPPPAAAVDDDDAAPGGGGGDACGANLVPPRLNRIGGNSSPRPKSPHRRPSRRKSTMPEQPPFPTGGAAEAVRSSARSTANRKPPALGGLGGGGASSPQADDGEENGDESPAFGPFADPIVDPEWSPFGAGGGEEDVPQSREAGEDGEASLFRIDDDDNDDSPVGGGEESPSILTAEEEELDGLRKTLDSEYDRAIEDQEISWKARYGATRLSFLASVLLMLTYLWLGCMFYRSEAGWSVPDALLFTVYTVTTVGYGGPQMIPDTASFHAFTSVYIIAGISLVTVLAAHTWQLVTLEATRMRSSPWSGRRRKRGGAPQEEGERTSEESATDDDVDGREEEETSQIERYRRQFAIELEDLARERPVLDAALAKVKECRLYLRSTRSGRVLGVMLPFLGMIFLGAGVVGTIEGWSPLASIYWSIVTLTTVGYGDYVPTKRSSVWFCTLFFIPSSLFFLSFLLAHVAKSYIRMHAIHVGRLERRMRRDGERRRAAGAGRSGRAAPGADAAAADAASDTGADPSWGGGSGGSSGSPGRSPRAEDVERGFKTVFSYNEDERSMKSSGLFGDQAGTIDDVNGNDNDPLSSENSPASRYRENVIRTKESAPDSRGNRAVTFAEAHRSLCRQSRRAPGPGGGEGGGRDATAKPSLDVRLRVQSRLARIIAEEVAGYQTGVVIKGSTVSLTIAPLRDTADKWKIPPGAWKAFRAVAFRSLLFVGERDLIADGGEALLRLNVVEVHQIFSPLLAAFGDGGSMEAWLLATDILADVELRGGTKYGRAKPVFNGTFT